MRRSNAICGGGPGLVSEVVLELFRGCIEGSAYGMSADCTIPCNRRLIHQL